MDLRYYLRKAQDVSPKEYLSVFPMLAALVLLPFVKKKYAKTWVICERPDEAQDNGYHFFKFMVQTHPEQDCIYFIDPHCAACQKVKALGRVEKYGGIRHWLYYFSARYLISSQTFKPSWICIALERGGIYDAPQIFLQHGITINKAVYLLASRRKMKAFITGAAPEYAYVKSTFGYPPSAVWYTGLARFDALHDFTVVPGRVLIIPTWRKWLVQKSEQHSDTDSDLSGSEYIKRWHDLLNSQELIELIKRYRLEVLFYPHPNMKKMIDISTLTNAYVKPASGDLQALMKSSQMMITDYSSVFFDMVYMKKPVIFYQFDEEKFRKYHYAQGWFDYHNTAFGRSLRTETEVVRETARLAENGFHVDDDYLAEHAKTFPLYDRENCQRIYKALMDNTAEE